jgi:hypothetical protein
MERLRDYCGRESALIVGTCSEPSRAMGLPPFLVVEERAERHRNLSKLIALGALRH